MNPIRPCLRAARPLPPKLVRHPLLQRRLQSTTTDSARSFHPAAVGGIAGAVTAFATTYLWYQFSGTKALVRGAHDTKKYLDTVQAKFQDSAPNPDEALKWLRQTASSYAGFVPGASGVVNSAFDELDSIHHTHRDDVDRIINDAYTELKQVSQKGLSVDTAKQGWDIVLKHLRRVHDLAGDVMSEVLDRHPEVKDKVGSPIEKLRQMGDRIGPEATHIVDNAWKQAQEIVNNNEGGPLSPANIARVQKVIDDATDRLSRYSEDAWKKAMDQAKPYLDKVPELKKLVEDNTAQLKSGNTKELLDKLQAAAKSGDTSDLKDYINRSARKVQSSGSASIQEYLSKIPNGDQILPNLGKLQDVAQRHGKEAEDLFKSTVGELTEVLRRKGEEARQIAERAEKEASSGGGSGQRQAQSGKAQGWFGGRN